MEEDNLAVFNELDIDLEAAASDEIWSPDAAFDMIWMMSNADWEALDKAWWRKSIGWKVSCAYILGHGPINPSQLFLRRALQDNSPEVVREASLSLIRLKELEPEEVDIELEVLKSLIEKSEQNLI